MRGEMRHADYSYHAGMEVKEKGNSPRPTLPIPQPTLNPCTSSHPMVKEERTKGLKKKKQEKQTPTEKKKN